MLVKTCSCIYPDCCSICLNISDSDDHLPRKKVSKIINSLKEKNNLLSKDYKILGEDYIHLSKNYNLFEEEHKEIIKDYQYSMKIDYISIIFYRIIILFFIIINIISNLFI